MLQIASITSFRIAYTLTCVEDLVQRLDKALYFFLGIVVKQAHSNNPLLIQPQNLIHKTTRVHMPIPEAEPTIYRLDHIFGILSLHSETDHWHSLCLVCVFMAIDCDVRPGVQIIQEDPLQVLLVLCYRGPFMTMLCTDRFQILYNGLNSSNKFVAGTCQPKLRAQTVAGVEKVAEAPKPRFCFRRGVQASDMWTVDLQTDDQLGIGLTDVVRPLPCTS